MNTVLHYTGGDDDHGGIVSVIRALAAAGRFDCVLGVNPGCVQHRAPSLPVFELPRLTAEEISLLNLWRARTVARAVRIWLRGGEGRVFHGHSRAGLLVALWLRLLGESRIVASVHCYGRQRWFYRWAARRLAARLFWLTPQMRRYYGMADGGWAQCLPGGVTEDFYAIAPATPVPGRLRLGGAGQLVRWKRWNLVLAALALLPEEISAQISFEHIGAATGEVDSQAYAGELRRLAGTLGGADNIFWRGPEQSSHRLLSVVDLVVVPAHNEPYSMIIQEALAAGVPVIAANSGGPPDVVRPGENGWLFADGDARGLAGIFEQLVRMRDWTKLDQATVRQSARRASEVAERWREIYAQL